ncbi:1-phosphatidylinositol phosphodiesterase-like [Polymixia lowei]
MSIFCNGKDLFFNDNGKLQLPQSYNIPWMAAIDDCRKLSLITIPGTHDSMALHGGPLADCQALALKDQLRAGVRYLDLKVFALDDALYVMQGVMYQRSTFREVLDTVRAFLSEFRSEAVLIRVKPEAFDKASVNQMVQSLISNDQHVWVSSGMPTMGKIRGKIVFVQNSSFTLGVPLIDTDGKGDNTVSSTKKEDSKIMKHLRQATEACGGDNVVLTYSSGTGFGTFWDMFLSPKRVAEKVNPWLNQYLLQFYPTHPRPCFGVIAMDFPGIDLLQTVISLNLW